MAKVSKHRSRRWLGVAALGLLVVLLLLFAGRQSTRDDEVPTAEVQRGRFEIDVRTVGTLQAVQSRTLPIPRLKTATIKVVDLIPEGTTVQPGDTLAVFDSTDVVRRIEDLESRLISARANFTKLKATQAARMAELRASLLDQHAAVRLAELSSQNVSYEARVEQERANLALNRSRLQLEQLESKLQSQNTIHQAELTESNVTVASLETRMASEVAALQNHVMVAPAAGLVVYGTRWSSGRRTKIKLGDELHYGVTVVELPDLREMAVRTYVNESRVNVLRQGQHCEVVVDAFPDTMFTGEISRVNVLGRELGDAAGVKVFDFDVKIQGADFRLRPGMTASITVKIEVLEDVLFAPLECVQSDRQGFFVYSREGSDFERRPVTLRERNDFFVILTSGVSEDEPLALRTPASFRKP